MAVNRGYVDLGRYQKEMMDQMVQDNRMNWEEAEKHHKWVEARNRAHQLTGLRGQSLSVAMGRGTVVERGPKQMTELMAEHGYGDMSIAEYEARRRGLEWSSETLGWKPRQPMRISMPKSLPTVSWDISGFMEEPEPSDKKHQKHLHDLFFARRNKDVLAI